MVNLRTYDFAKGRGKVISIHPNIEGAKLSALSFVQNGDTIRWIFRKRILLGVVNNVGGARFCIERRGA